MELWERLLDVLRMLRPQADRRYYELDEPLQAALQERADREKRPLKQFQAELLAARLADLQTADTLKHFWDRLSHREQQVTALTCLGYTNRQIAARLIISPETVKSHMRQVLVKFHAHSKEELRILLAKWDFSDGGSGRSDIEG